MSEGIAALAAAGGAAVVQAAGTDTWEGVRTLVARLLGRGDPQQESAELQLLDRTHSELAGLGSDQLASHESGRWQGIWQTRLEMLIAGVSEGELGPYVDQLQRVIALAQAQSAGFEPQSVTAGRDLSVRSDHGSVAGGIVSVEGDLRVERPFPPPVGEGSP
ncbi:hypothetical protein [Streptomyces sp. NBC_01261]|uniref:hypothetical protein n=1 Tax=unclassified Streptomyces TaxID=2593676 RepID=UPI002E3251AF|nr:hypothetical protein [Streptomyces sp. NBC_01261]